MKSAVAALAQPFLNQLQASVGLKEAPALFAAFLRSPWPYHNSTLPLSTPPSLLIDLDELLAIANQVLHYSRCLY